MNVFRIFLMMMALSSSNANASSIIDNLLAKEGKLSISTHKAIVIDNNFPYPTGKNLAKSSLRNKTGESINITYHIVRYEYNSRTGETYGHTNSSEESIVLEPNELFEYRLNMEPLDNEILKMERLFVTKITSQMRYQYFIIDYSDYAAYKEWKNTAFGVIKGALSCILVAEKNKNIYPTLRGFVCAN